LIDQEKFNQWEQKIGPVENYVKRYTFPIYSSSDGKNFELFGSSIGILIFGGKYICTANHLIEEISKTGANVVIGVNGKFESLNLDTVISIKEEAIDYDLCLVELNGNPDHVQYLHQQEFYQDDKYDDRSWQYLQGFPISKNKYHDIHDHENEIISTAYLKTAIKIDQSISHSFKGVNDKTHLLFKYEESVYKKEGGIDIESKKRRNMPGLKGLSGCGIWTINNVTNIPTIKLAGIFILFKSGIGAGTKAKCILELNNWSRIKHYSIGVRPRFRRRDFFFPYIVPRR